MLFIRGMELCGHPKIATIHGLVESFKAHSIFDVCKYEWIVYINEHCNDEIKKCKDRDSYARRWDFIKKVYVANSKTKIKDV